MQKRPKTPYCLEYAPVSLSEDFSITDFSGVYQQSDKPITRLHIHNCLEVGYCHSGSGIFVIEDKVFPFRKGNVSVINHREMHLAQSSKKTFSEWTFILLDPFKLLGGCVDDPGLLDTSSLCGPLFRNILTGRQHADIAQIMRELVNEMADKKPGYRSCARGLVWTLMARLCRLSRGSKTEAVETGRRNIERVAPALQYMATRYMEPLRMTVLARACFMSLTNFRRLFGQTIKKTPFEYLTHVRIQMAAALLADTDKTILEVSLEAGYSTLSSFNRQFKAAMGMPPRAWRSKAAQAARNRD